MGMWLGQAMACGLCKQGHVVGASKGMWLWQARACGWGKQGHVVGAKKACGWGTQGYARCEKITL